MVRRPSPDLGPRSRPKLGHGVGNGLVVAVLMLDPASKSRRRMGQAVGFEPLIVFEKGLVQPLGPQKRDVAVFEGERAQRPSGRPSAFEHQVKPGDEPGSVCAGLAVNQQRIAATPQNVDQDQELAARRATGRTDGKVIKIDPCLFGGLVLVAVERVGVGPAAKVENRAQVAVVDEEPEVLPRLGTPVHPTGIHNAKVPFEQGASKDPDGRQPENEQDGHHARQSAEKSSTSDTVGSILAVQRRVSFPTGEQAETLIGRNPRPASSHIKRSVFDPG